METEDRNEYQIKSQEAETSVCRAAGSSIAGGADRMRKKYGAGNTVKAGRSGSAADRSRGRAGCR